MGSGDIDDNMTHHIREKWMKWRLASQVLCDEKVQPKLKVKFYKVVIRQSLLCKVKCWLVKNLYVEKIHIADIIMLRCMWGDTRSDMIRYEVIKKEVGVVTLVEKMREVLGRQDERSETDIVWTYIEEGINIGKV